jgi:hypothetical protein
MSIKQKLRRFATMKTGPQKYTNIYQANGSSGVKKEKFARMKTCPIIKQFVTEQSIKNKLVEPTKDNCTSFINVNTDFCRIHSVSSI